MVKVNPKWGETAETLLKKALEAEDRHLRTRLMALSFVASGESGTLVASRLGKSRETIGNWVNRFNERGLPGLASGWKGNPRRILEKKEIDLLRDAVSRHPQRADLEAGQWTSSLVAAFIKQRFGKTVCPETARQYLHLMGFTHAGPAKTEANGPPGDARIAAHPKKLEQGQTHGAVTVYVRQGHMRDGTSPERGWLRHSERIIPDHTAKEK
ncbi:MAG: helix-turn-helix domain-containing protein [Desulfocurvibacter africanus]